MILLDDDELFEAMRYKVGTTTFDRQARNPAKAQAKKILIELQSIYKLPDLKMEHDRMGEFIQELMDEVSDNIC